MPAPTTATPPRAADRFTPPDPTAPTLYDTLATPIGELLLTSDGAALTGLHMLDGELPAPPRGSDWRRSSSDLRAATRQVLAYFAGELTRFEIPLAPSGTAFQLDVWSALLDIPHGGTASYGEIAAAVGRPTAPRAVGAANGRNPIAVIVPCHRVIGSGGALVGYGGGLDRKRLLLEHERPR